MVAAFVRVRPGDRCVRTGSSSFYGRTLGMPWWSLFSFRVVCPCALLWPLGSFEFVYFVWVRPRGSLVRSRSSGSSGAPGVSLRSVGFVWFVLLRFVGRWVNTGSSCSSGYALVVFGFVVVRLVRPCAR